MSIATALINFLRKKRTDEAPAAPEGLCPNCWGRTEYGGQFYTAMKNRGIDASKKDPDAGWVKEYADTHLKDIHLERQGDMVVCQKCKVSYKPE